MRLRLFKVITGYLYEAGVNVRVIALTDEDFTNIEDLTERIKAGMPDFNTDYAEYIEVKEIYGIENYGMAEETADFTHEKLTELFN